MPRVAFDIAFCAQLPKLQGTVRKGVFDAWEKFERLTLGELFKDPGLKLESLKNARDPHIRTIRIDRSTRGVVLAPDSGDTYVLLRVLPHDEANAWAIKQKASINTVTRAVEIRDIAVLEELTPAYERMELCDHLAETVWPEVTAALRRADLEEAARALKEASMVGKTAPAVYKLYEVNLSVQYESSPYSLGAVGEQLMAFES